jgi:hypothetical protein
MPVLPLDPETATPALRDVRELVCGVAAGFDARLLSRGDAAHALREWSMIANAAQTGLALAAARVDECGPPPSSGAIDGADYLATATGTSATRARETLARGRGLRALDQTRAVAAAGHLSPEQAGAIADAAVINPAAESELLTEAAAAPVGELRRRCAEKKAERQDLAAIEAQVHRRRTLRRYRDCEGAEHLHATGTRRALALIDQALNPLIDEQFRGIGTACAPETHEARAFDALVSLAERSLAVGGENAHAGSRRAPRSRDPIRHLSVLRLDLSALVRGRAAAGETCELAGLGPISVAAAREMLGESVLKLVLTKGVEVRNVTHLGRGPIVAQKVALLWERPVCQREGCGRRARLEYDHIDGFEFRTTGHTRIDELDPLCAPDHDLKTYQGWALVHGRGVRPMVPPDDRRHPRHRSARGP